MSCSSRTTRAIKRNIPHLKAVNIGCLDLVSIIEAHLFWTMPSWKFIFEFGKHQLSGYSLKTHSWIKNIPFLKKSLLKIYPSRKILQTVKKPESWGRWRQVNFLAYNHGFFESCFISKSNVLYEFPNNGGLITIIKSDIFFLKERKKKSRNV